MARCKGKQNKRKPITLVNRTLRLDPHEAFTARILLELADWRAKATVRFRPTTTLINEETLRQRLGTDGAAVALRHYRMMLAHALAQTPTPCAPALRVPIALLETAQLDFVRYERGAQRLLMCIDQRRQYGALVSPIPPNAEPNANEQRLLCHALWILRKITTMTALS